MQKPFQFCIPALKTPQPEMPYCEVGGKSTIVESFNWKLKESFGTNDQTQGIFWPEIDQT